MLLHHITAAIVLAEVPRPVRLPRQHDRGGERGTSRKATCLRHSPCNQHSIGSERGIGCKPVSMRISKAGPLSGGRPGGGSAITSAYYSPAGAATRKSGGSLSSTGSVNAGPQAAMWPTSSSVQSESVVLASVRPAGVSLAERRDLAEAVGALEREGLSWREARGRRIRVGRRGRPRPSCRGKCSRARAASRGKEEDVGMKTEGDALFGVGGIGGWGSRASP